MTKLFFARLATIMLFGATVGYFVGTWFPDNKYFLFKREHGPWEEFGGKSLSGTSIEISKESYTNYIEYRPDVVRSVQSFSVQRGLVSAGLSMSILLLAFNFRYLTGLESKPKVQTQPA